MIKIALIGSTGSIGRQVLNVVDRYPKQFKIISLAAGYNAALLKDEIIKYSPKYASIIDKGDVDFSGLNTQMYYGEESSLDCITNEADVIFIAVVGYAGVKVFKKAIEVGKKICLANKECLVSAGELLMPLANEKNIDVVPVDSEHSAIWQSLGMDRFKKFKKIYLTASGGALRDVSINKLSNIKKDEALKHPNWLMGEKITIDCATMVNKAFEVAEAKYLFNTTLDSIDVLIHPQSIIHSMVEFDDGAVISQMGIPSMETPIQLALTYPDRMDTKLPELNLVGQNLTFEKVDNNRYPCFNLVLDAIERGGVYPCSISSANEEIVKLYLENRISFGEIYTYLKYVLDNTPNLEMSFENLDYINKFARQLVINKYRKEV